LALDDQVVGAAARPQRRGICHTLNAAKAAFRAMRRDDRCRRKAKREAGPR
jgi:hypothetical protein